jgi:hypothetical protein
MRMALAVAGLLAAGVLANDPAHAQFNQAISDAELYGAWDKARAAAISLTGTPANDAGMADADARTLDSTLASLGPHLEDIAIRIVAQPEFAYDASQASFELSQEIGTVVTQWEAWVAHYPPAPEATAAALELARFRDLLAQRTAFERDVLLALGSGSKHAIQALSRRWWGVSERVEALRAALPPQSH